MRGNPASHKRRNGTPSRPGSSSPFESKIRGKQPVSPDEFRTLAFGKITLQRADLKIPAQIGADALRGRHGTRKSGVIWHFMQEGSPPQRAAVGQRLRPLRRIEDQLNIAIHDGIDDMRPPLKHFVHFFGWYAAIGEETL